MNEIMLLQFVIHILCESKSSLIHGFIHGLGRVGCTCPKGMPPTRARAPGMPWGQKRGHKGASMNGENQQLVTSEPVEFEK